MLLFPQFIKYKTFELLWNLDITLKPTGRTLKKNVDDVYETIEYSKQSPPAWTQEAYCPPRSKCSLCWWGGVPHPVMGGTQSSHDGGVPHPVMGGTPSSHDGGYPSSHDGEYPSSHDGVGYPIQSRWGVPHPVIRGYPPPSRPGWGTPPTTQTWPGYLLHHLDLAGVPPTTIQTWSGYPPAPSRPGQGTPPRGVDWQTNWKQYLPPSFGCGR